MDIFSVKPQRYEKLAYLGCSLAPQKESHLVANSPRMNTSTNNILGSNPATQANNSTDLDLDDPKGQLISECLLGLIDFPKKQLKIWQISALESKKWSNQQSKSTFL